MGHIVESQGRVHSITTEAQGYVAAVLYGRYNVCVYVFVCVCVCVCMCVCVVANGCAMEMK